MSSSVIEASARAMGIEVTPDELVVSLTYTFSFLTSRWGQIYAALTYYWDHKNELDADIERRDREVEEIRREVGPSALTAKLRRTPS